MEMENKTEVFSGLVTDLREIKTRTGLSMVTFSVSGKKCKAFAELAHTCAKLDGKEVQMEAKQGSFRGEKEYAIISVNARIDGEEISAKDTRTSSASPAVVPSGP